MKVELYEGGTKLGKEGDLTFGVDLPLLQEEIRIDGRRYKVVRRNWKYVTGELREGESRVRVRLMLERVAA